MQTVLLINVTSHFAKFVVSLFVNRAPVWLAPPSGGGHTSLVG